ncbi:hypothetical protein [Sphingobacterium sp. IITKGP-BTPF85]|uniref:hypothetical protein n=1 Tax=Sphingobacterium sp. IITKGP-BTPF85 TaxID=1338009 RepID=UPI001E539BB5|nr:hypothetical protein [Sphingobacterium sp. IITKGP-BTPF85]
MGEPKQLTQDLRNNRELTFNADKSHAVYLSGRDEVRLLDLTTLNSKTVVKDELWAFQNSSPSFSPDGKYILFTAIRNFEQDIFVHHIGSGQTTNLTNTGVTEASPSWSPDGKYIYFASNRTKPSFPTGMQNSSIFRMALENFDEPYRISKFNELFSQPVKKDTITDNKNDNKTKAKDKKEEKATSSSTDKKVLVTIDVKGLRDRIEQVSPAFGTQSDPIAIQKEKKTMFSFHPITKESTDYTEQSMNLLKLLKPKKLLTTESTSLSNLEVSILSLIEG